MEDVEYMIETELIKNDCDEFKRNEEALHQELDSARFFSIIKNHYGYEYDTISKYIQGGNYSFNEQHDFNITLRKMKREHDIDISDSIVFLEETINMNYILKFIDDETEWVLKNELSTKYNINMKPNKLFEILY